MQEFFNAINQSFASPRTLRSRYNVQKPALARIAVFVANIEAHFVISFNTVRMLSETGTRSTLPNKGIPHHPLSSIHLPSGRRQPETMSWIANNRHNQIDKKTS